MATAVYKSAPPVLGGGGPLGSGPLGGGLRGGINPSRIARGGSRSPSAAASRIVRSAPPTAALSETRTSAPPTSTLSEPRISASVTSSLPESRISSALRSALPEARVSASLTSALPESRISAPATSSLSEARIARDGDWVARNGDRGLVRDVPATIELPLSEAPDGRCEYYSTTHEAWIPAKVTASDAQTGAVQIDKKPSVWISPGEQKSRLRVTRASVERAAKDRRETELQQPSIGSRIYPAAALDITAAASSSEPGEAASSSYIPASAWAPRVIGRSSGLGSERPLSLEVERVIGRAALSGSGDAVAPDLSSGVWYRSGLAGGSAASNQPGPRFVSDLDATSPSIGELNSLGLSARISGDLAAANALLSSDARPASPGCHPSIRAAVERISAQAEVQPRDGSRSGGDARGSEVSGGGLISEAPRSFGLPRNLSPPMRRLSPTSKSTKSKPIWESVKLGDVKVAELNAGSLGSETLKAKPSTYKVLAPAADVAQPAEMSRTSGPPQSLAPPAASGTPITGFAAVSSTSSRAGRTPIIGTGAAASRGGLGPVSTNATHSPPVPAAPVALGTAELPTSVQSRIVGSLGEAASEASPVAFGNARTSPSFANSRSNVGTLGASTAPLAVTSATVAPQADSSQGPTALSPPELSEAAPQPAATETNDASPTNRADATSSAQPPAQPLPLGDTIAFDEYGKPTIIRQINPDSGAARTVVLNDDGSHRVFGEHTVTSLTNSSKEETNGWIDALSCHQLRGLVHEVGQRLLEGSRLYHARLNQLDKMGEHLNYIFFGLTADASDKDLDNAYRKLAKIMHPDKNGGTEAAKKRFQQMKERYEAIKKKRCEGEDEAESDDGAGPPDEEEGATRELKDRKQKVDDENAANNAEDDADKASSIEYDPQDRGSMEKTVGKMLGQLKNVEIQMKVVVKELGRISTQNPGAFQVA